MKNLFLMFLLWNWFYIGSLSAYNLRNLDTIVSKIEKVTLFTSGAQITRSGKLTLKKGLNKFIVTSIASDVVDGTLRLTTGSEFPIQNMDYLKIEYTSRKLRPELEEKTKQIKLLEFESTKIDLQIAPIIYERTLLEKNQSVAGSENGMQASDLIGVVTFHRSSLDSIVQKLFMLNHLQQANLEERTRVQKEIDLIKRTPLQFEGQFLFEINSDRNVAFNFTLSYLISNASWYVDYDARIPAVGLPIELMMKANIRQGSGEDWKDVDLVLSNGSPKSNQVFKNIEPQVLGNSYNQKMISGRSIFAGKKISGKVTDAFGAALTSANVLVKGTSIGTTTDLDGNFELTLPNDASLIEIAYVGYETLYTSINSQYLSLVLRVSNSMLDEVVMTGVLAGGVPKHQMLKDIVLVNEVGPPTKLEESPIFYQFILDGKNTLLADGNVKKLELKFHSIPAEYNYLLAPKEEKAAFLNVKLTGWQGLQLLAGQTNLYFEGTYIGKSIIEPSQLSDTLQLSFGRDENIVVDYSRTKYFHSKSSYRDKEFKEVSYEIAVKNTKKTNIRLTIYDQFPKSNEKNIKIDDKKYKGALLDEDTQILSWNLELKPGEERKLEFSFKVEYPLGMNLNF